MIFKELLQNCKWVNIAETLTKDYEEHPEAITAFKNIYFKLLSYEPENNPDGMRICVELVKGFDDEEYHNVFGLDSNNGRWGLDFIPWREWLGYDVELGDLSPDEFSAHAIWEMTFNGTEEQMEQKKQELINTASKISNDKILRSDTTCPFCEGTGKNDNGDDCFCENGKLNTFRTMKD
ncbi:hypothetical protein Q7A53_05595 [Halobacillus rhizosphaerae]|uniref:DUF6557 family protein n=1 Tax=Halobacillus rhizosphaerae TaxID=3064889 RepID=UPI00398B9F17